MKFNKLHLFVLPALLHGAVVVAAPKTMKIEHPLAKQGLERIEADGTYVYYVPPSTRSESASFRLGMMPAPSAKRTYLKNDNKEGVINFKDMYKTSSLPILEVNYEWQPFNKWGKLGILTGIGFFTASGKGRFNDGEEAQESYTLVGLPLTLGGIYRFEFSGKQLIAPYVSGGATYFGLAEIRDDGKTPTVAGSLAGFGSAGLLVSIGRWDAYTGPMLQSEYGIANMWVNIEARVLGAVTTEIDFTGSYFTMGMTVDF
ncbi:MAG TPA: hypothetical protein PLU50_11890 [Pseudobdellovibrionaceae bacterium]|nr:hypothetical protein [Pseudobdellovibrionaceae bacterium]